MLTLQAGFPPPRATDSAPHHRESSAMASRPIRPDSTLKPAGWAGARVPRQGPGCPGGPRLNPALQGGGAHGAFTWGCWTPCSISPGSRSRAWRRQRRRDERGAVCRWLAPAGGHDGAAQPGVVLDRDRPADALGPAGRSRTTGSGCRRWARCCTAGRASSRLRSSIPST